ncbi:MAG: PEP-CTERM sorting domain-containing protein [Coleofasciculus chthonoplastes F3-SA18-01]|uniref:PEP-CTERM sorting domain-containing protein n=1 Tax=Coleofasciculus chthonoplastes TaxID=64178 RepID=UPI0032F6EC05
MNKLSIAIAGAGFMALGIVGMAPAEAANLTQIDSSGAVAFDVDVSPLVSSFLPSEFQALLAPQQVDFDSTIIVNNAHGRLSDAEDEELTLGLSHVEDYLEAILPSTVLPLIDDIDVQGSILDSENNLLSGFDVFLRDNEIVAGNYNYGDIAGCLENTCHVLFDGNATASILFPSSVNLTVSGGFTQTAMSLVDDGSTEPGLVSFDYSITPINSIPEPIALLPVDSEAEPPVAEESSPETEPGSPGNENPSAEPEPPVAEEPPTAPPGELGGESEIASVPEPTTLLGLFGLGGFLAAKRKRMKAD